MAEKGSPSDTESLKDKLKKNETTINNLKEEVRKLQEKRKDHEKNCEPKIKKLEEEIERLKEENKELKTKVECLEKRNTSLEGKMEFIEQKSGELENKLNEHEKKLKSFELSEDELVIRQFCSNVVENIMKIVLKEYFDKFANKKTKDMGYYIRTQIPNEEKKEARSRWKKLKKEIKWDDHLIKQLKSVKERGNYTAHPQLKDVKQIDDAKINLQKEQKLNEPMVKAIEELQTIWKLTNDKLTHGTSSAEVQDQGGARNVPTTKQTKEDIPLQQATDTRKAAADSRNVPTTKQIKGDIPQHQATYASKAAAGARNVPTTKQIKEDIPLHQATDASKAAAGARNVPTTKQIKEDIPLHQDTYASKAAGERGGSLTPCRLVKTV